jgi:hypothetical protein
MEACKGRLSTLAAAHVPKCTLRSGSRNPPLSARPDLNLDTPFGWPASIFSGGYAARLNQDMKQLMRWMIQPIQNAMRVLQPIAPTRFFL